MWIFQVAGNLIEYAFVHWVIKAMVSCIHCHHQCRLRRWSISLPDTFSTKSSLVNFSLVSNSVVQLARNPYNACEKLIVYCSVYSQQLLSLRNCHSRQLQIFMWPQDYLAFPKTCRHKK